MPHSDTSEPDALSSSQGRSPIGGIISPAVDLKGSVFTLTVLRLRSRNLDAIQKELEERIAQGPRFFENAPVVIDLELMKDAQATFNFAHLVKMLASQKLIPVGVRHGNSEQNAAAIQAGMAILKGGAIQDLPVASTPAAKPSRQTATESEPVPRASQKPQEIGSGVATKVVTQAVRSGQRIYAQGGDLILLAGVNAGAEIIADGNIHVYGPLRGRALAGVKGAVDARIFCQFMEAELVAIAGHYRVFEDSVPNDLRRKPAQIYLDGETLVVEPLVQG